MPRPRPRSKAASPCPVNGPITSYFGYRYHPILHFTRFHAGLDIGAGWGSPIVAAGDGQVVSAGWAGGYGREVRIAHGGGIVSRYGHMSEIVAAPGSFVRRGQLIGYVGSSGLSTGPHLHFEVSRAASGKSARHPLRQRAGRRPACRRRGQGAAEGIAERRQRLPRIGAQAPHRGFSIALTQISRSRLAFEQSLSDGSGA